MPTRVRQDLLVEEESSPTAVVAPKLLITEGMVDEAADRALSGVAEEVAFATRKLWAVDTSLEVAHAFHVSEADVRERSNFSRVANIKYTCPYVLTSDQVRSVVECYPEFDVVFHNGQLHDHPVAAAFRSLDQKLLEAGVPPQMAYSDFGGSVLSHVERGDDRAVTVGGDMDMKDPVRLAHMRLRLKMIASGKVVCPGGDVSRKMALSILANEGIYFIESDARCTPRKTMVGIMNQVYDIPMEGIPNIMDSAGMCVLEGAIHYNPDVMELSSGEFRSIGARFEVDREKDLFSMGFVGSPTPWYRHKLSDYLRYGADQVLQGHDHLYSYKVTQRRGDTLFFRVLRVGDQARPNRRQYYALPGVDVVDVDGFELAEGSLLSTAPLKRKTWRFPAGIWDTLLRDAAVRAARGGLNYQDLVDTYRVSVVPHQLNGVNISGGTAVEMDLLGPMVLHAGFCAYADTVLLETEVSYSMDEARQQRGLANESTLYKGFKAFLAIFTGMSKALKAPFDAITEMLVETKRTQLREMLIMWRPVQRVRRLHASNILDLSNSSRQFLGATETPFKEFLLDRQARDLLFDVAGKPELAAEILSACGDYLPPSYKTKLSTVAGPETTVSGDAPTSKGKVVSAGDNVSTDAGAIEGAHVVRAPHDPNRQENRDNAIREAIEENNNESQSIETACLKNLRELTVGGAPQPRLAERHKSRMGNPDLWRVQNGVIVESMLGYDPSEFVYAAVCCPRPSASTGSHLWSVIEQDFSGQDSSTGKMVERVHFVVADGTYSGWVLVCDSLKIYNGPDSLAAMEEALVRTAEYDVEVHQGGPGAGKTTQICENFRIGDAVICPVRQSTEDTRAKLREKFPDQPMSYWKKYVRTVDSVLVNLLTSDKDVGFQVAKIHADEAFMAHAGKWHSVFRLLGASQVVAYGDTKQIPHVPRVNTTKLYTRLTPDVWVYHWMVYRCRPEIMAVWVKPYDYKLRTPLLKGGVCRRVDTHVGVEIKPNTALLCMYQADKVTIKALFPRDKVKIMTVHESEGKTFDNVVLFNFESRKRPAEDIMYLFNKPEYVVVASSRARNSFIYVKKAKEPDLLVKWMSEAEDPRRVAAVMDVASAGESKEFL